MILISFFPPHVWLLHVSCHSLSWTLSLVIVTYQLPKHAMIWLDWETFYPLDVNCLFKYCLLVTLATYIKFSFKISLVFVLYFKIFFQISLVNIPSSCFKLYVIHLNSSLNAGFQGEKWSFTFFLVRNVWIWENIMFLLICVGDLCFTKMYVKSIFEGHLLMSLPGTSILYFNK